MAVAGWVLTARGAEPLKIVVEKDVAVPMRDGVILRADICRPEQGGPWPVLLMRTPYGKRAAFERMAREGYIVVCQDARGRYASEGQWESFVRFQTHDAEDGYDTVQWCARLPGATGKVGTFGTSYCAFLQWRTASLRPPALVAMSAHSIPGRYVDLEGPGTMRPSRRLKWWAVTMSPDMRLRSGRPGAHTGQEATNLWDSGYGDRLLGFVPWLELPWEVFEEETGAMRHWLRNPHLEMWNLDKGCRETVVPNLDVVGWYDHCNGDMLLYRTLSGEGKTETARRNTKILIGPWGHNSLGRRKCGPFDFGPEADVDLVEMDIRWFDCWLKGRATGIDRQAPVRYFMMGENRWREATEWPPRPAGTEKVFFLDSDGRANTRAGDGLLGLGRPAAAKTDRYVYDPRDPVPSLYPKGGFAAAGDQRALAERRDVLVYQTAPLEEPVEVVGHPVVELWAASSAPDTDWFARLVDVAPSGEARDVCLGMVRTRYRDGLDRPKLLESGQTVRYTIRLGPTANTFLAGHRLRLDVTSSDFPNYDRNHNTAADQNADAALAPAEQTVWHGGDQASRIILPSPRPRVR